MPAEVYQVLFESETLRPLAARPDALAVRHTGHDSVVVFDDVVDRQHPKSKFLCLQFLWNGEVGWDERNDLGASIHSRDSCVDRLMPNDSLHRRFMKLTMKKTLTAIAIVR
jgi:hypothetical protein